MNVFMFSGQGSQYYHMAEGIYQSNKLFRENMTEMDNMIYEISGKHIVEEIFNNSKLKGEPFDDITYTHPSIFMIEYAISKTLMEYGIIPDYLIGTSLGELVAACISNAIKLEDAIFNIIKQAECFEKNCKKGGMISVLSSHKIYQQMYEIFEDTEIAAINYEGHFIVSGYSRAIKNTITKLEKYHIPFVVLPVKYGFHSTCIDEVKDCYLSIIKNFDLYKPKIRMVSCVKAQEIESIDHEYLWNVARKPILFQETIKYMERKGSYNYIDISVGGNLAGFTKRILSSESKSSIEVTETPFSNFNENVLKIKNKIMLQ